MRKTFRFVTVLCVCAAMTLGVSSVMAGKKSQPAPEPPPLCACTCPDSSIVVAHCDSCLSFCSQDM